MENNPHDKSLNDLDDVKNDNKIKNKKLREEANMEDYNEEDEEEEEDLTEALLVQMGYWKPEPKKPPPMASPNVGIKLVSAMKGSREKEGIDAEEGRRVSWAPDVYDPVPKSPEHFARGRTVVKMKIENKKGGKNKQKPGAKGASPGGGGGGGGGGGKGGKGKDKKQVKKYGGSSSKCFDSLDEDGTLVDGGDRYARYEDYY